MAVVIVRLSLIYLLLTVTVRLMGKRQLGEMQMSELVTMMMLSELAVFPVTDTGVPLLFSVVPILLLAVFEILISFGVLHSPRLQNLLDGNPVVIIHDGIVIEEALRSVRMTLPELLGELRLKSVRSPDEVSYAILEGNGKLSVIPKKSCTPPDCQTMQKQVMENGIAHTVICDGVLDTKAINTVGKTKEDVLRILKKNGYKDIRQVFYLSIDDTNTIQIIGKGK